jgi:aminopeptidase N
MSTESPVTKYLKDYNPPAFQVDRLDLKFQLADTDTLVQARLMLSRHPDRATASSELLLDGDPGLQLEQLVLDGRKLSPRDYTLTPHSLTLHQVPDQAVLDITTRIQPASNAALEGLYASGGNLYTQCEAEGFRRIMFYLDRPDVMTRFTTTLIADKHKYPVLLSNGNLVGAGQYDKTRHWAKWVDPFRKPSYLFALVAGRLALVEDHFITRSGRRVALQIYVETGNQDKCAHAMAALKRAMRWDEDTFGLEYDLDRYMIVAVSDFNMGAMENKGLNLFNAKYVLAKPDTATDADYDGIEGVIAHEYFHNWSGNRVTCRDWFQLSLKEGLTVFRDQEYSSDVTSRAVKRIEDVRLLRSAQFSEDAGPMAHPVRPQSYIEISNFYTATVYEKGAEVVRMLHHLLGDEGFKRGLACYFKRHDGQAVTTDDFIAALADTNGVDLTQFKRWYDQAGTPTLAVRGEWAAGGQAYTLHINQSCPPNSGNQDCQPYHIPLAIGLLGADGQDLPLQLRGENAPQGTTRVLSITEPVQAFTFVNLPHKPVPSILRGFSAPVKLQASLSEDDLLFLLGHDSDPFNRWEAGQALLTQELLRLVVCYQQSQALQVNTRLMAALGSMLQDDRLDPAQVALTLTLPAENYLAEQMLLMDVDAIHHVREYWRQQFALQWREGLLRVYQQHNHADPYRYQADAVGRRSLSNLCLSYLALLPEPRSREILLRQFDTANNMTDRIAALAALAQRQEPATDAAFERFYAQWQHEPLIVDKWLQLQATASRPDTLHRVRQLQEHPAFSFKTPNKVYALIGAFCQRNPVCFHAADGGGYVMLTDAVLHLDNLNPQVAARLTAAFNRWKKLDMTRQQQVRTQLERLLAKPALSRDVYEIVAKNLAV